MKRLFIILVAGLVACCSCNMDGYYYVENADDFVTVKEGALVNDFGTPFTVKENTSGQPWDIPGQRSYIIFDVLSRNYDIRLKQQYPALSPIAQLITEKGDPKDPVLPIQCYVSGGYLNMTMEYYEQNGSDWIHTFRFDYTWDATEHQLNLFLIHEGNNENPVYVASGMLTTQFKVISLPLQDLAPVSKDYTLCVFIDALAQNTTNNSYIVQTAQIFSVDL